MKFILLLVFCAVIAACDSANVVAAQSDSVSVEGYELSLRADGETCLLHYKINSQIAKHALAPKPPCYFSRNKDGSLKNFSYPDVNVAAALIVIGTPASAEKRARWNLPEDVQCGEQNQGVLIKNGEVKVSTHVGAELFCRDRGVDEKNFWRYAHE